MSRLMDDLKRLNETRKTESSIVVQDAEEPRKAPVASNHKTVYFIGFLIVLIVALSAFSMTLSLKTLSRIESVEGITASTSAEILARLKNSEMVSGSLLKTLKRQGSEMQALQALIAQQNEEELARIDGLKDRVKELKVALKEKEEEFEEIMFAHNSLKTSVQNSIYDLKAADKFIKDKQILLDGQVKKIVETNSYLYSTY